jgi:hypothetical protein
LLLGPSAGGAMLDADECSTSVHWVLLRTFRDIRGYPYLTENTCVPRCPKLP